MARRFVDARGTEWEVWEVTSQRAFADRAPRPWVPPGAVAESQWLCFESPTQLRRLARYPERWQAMADPDLEGLCAAAELEAPAAVRRIVAGLADLR